MSAAHQSEVSCAFVHERREAAGCVSEPGLPAGRLHYDYSSWQFFYSSAYMSQGKNEMLQAALIKKTRTGGKVSVCSVLTSRISILSRIMRFAQNSSARRPTEMSVPFRAGRRAPKCCTNILPECFMQHVERKKTRHSIRTEALPISLPPQSLVGSCYLRPRLRAYSEGLLGEVNL